jgi:hypothetical protein
MYIIYLIIIIFIAIIINMWQDIKQHFNQEFEILSFHKIKKNK